nr:MAG TPA: intron associated endonuclease [Caudoviricetes sp.]
MLGRSNSRVYRKMKKNPNFEKSIIEDNLKECDVDKFEIYYIWLYNSYSKLNPEFGLNLTIGGQGSHGYKHTEEAKKKMRENYKYHYNDNGIYHKGSIPPNKGKPQSDWLSPEKREICRLNAIKNCKLARERGTANTYQKGQIPYNIRKCKIKNILTDEIFEFDSISSAAKFMGYASDKTMSKYYNNNRIMKGKWFFIFDLKGGDA